MPATARSHARTGAGMPADARRDHLDPSVGLDSWRPQAPHRKEFVSKAVVAAFPALASFILRDAFICSDCSTVRG